MSGLKWSQKPVGLCIKCPACKKSQDSAHGILYTYENDKEEWLAKCECGSIILATKTQAKPHIKVKVVEVQP